MPVVGIDIGGSGIKGAPVELRRGTLVGDRFRVKTPQPAKPEPMLDTVAEVLDHVSRPGPIGITFPGVVVADGTVRTAPNLHQDWVGLNVARMAADRLDRDVLVLNDADAAGVAEVAHGAARGARGVVLVLTFGTGVGSGLFVDGKLVPNTELGHLPMDGKDAEKRVAESVREKKDWTWRKWAKRANDYLALVEQLFSPDLIIIGGGIAKRPDDFLSLLEARAPVRVAALGNEAGIVGAAMAAYDEFGRRRATAPRKTAVAVSAAT